MKRSILSITVMRATAAVKGLVVFTLIDPTGCSTTFKIKSDFAKDILEEMNKNVKTVTKKTLVKNKIEIKYKTVDIVIDSLKQFQKVFLFLAYGDREIAVRLIPQMIHRDNAIIGY